MMESCFKTLTGHDGAVACLDVYAPAGLVASGGADKTVRLWDVAEGVCTAAMKGHTGWIRAIQIEGERVFSGSGDKTVKVRLVVRLWWSLGYSV